MRVLVVPLALLTLLLGCARSDDRASRPTPSSEPARPSAEVPATPSTASVPGGDAGSTFLAAPPAPGIAWAAVVHPRRDVYELTLAHVRSILDGGVRDWSEVGGSPGPIDVHVPAEDRSAIEAALGVVLAARSVPAAELLDVVAADRARFGLVRVEALTPRVLPLVVEGYDPLRDPASLSPLRTEGALPDFDPVLVTAIGEVIPARCVGAAIRADGQGASAFDGLRPLLERADIAVTSLDAALSSAGPATPCERTFVLQGSPLAATAMASAGLDVVFVNGNHVMDCWSGCPRERALRDTLEALHTAGLATAGAGADEAIARRPAIVDAQPPPQAEAKAHSPIRIAFLAYDGVMPGNWARGGASGTAPLLRDALIEDVRVAATHAEVVIVGLSMGDEYTFDPTPGQRDFARAAIEAGATLVLGNHPHVPQTIEWYTGADGRTGLAAYALGNVLFDQTWSEPTMQSLAIEVGFEGGRLVGYRLHPVVNRGTVVFPTSPHVLAPTSPEGRAILERAWAAQDRLAP